MLFGNTHLHFIQLSRAVEGDSFAIHPLSGGAGHRTQKGKKKNKNKKINKSFSLFFSLSFPCPSQAQSIAAQIVPLFCDIRQLAQHDRQLVVPWSWRPQQPNQKRRSRFALHLEAFQ
jgi:hypothetical protein